MQQSVSTAACHTEGWNIVDEDARGAQKKKAGEPADTQSGGGRGTSRLCNNTSKVFLRNMYYVYIHPTFSIKKAAGQSKQSPRLQGQKHAGSCCRPLYIGLQFIHLAARVAASAGVTQEENTVLLRVTVCPPSHLQYLAHVNTN